MGFGDPHHIHPLRFYMLPEKRSICCRCEKPITGKSYGCTRCNHFVHKLCAEIPKRLWHPLHVEHPLILTPPTPTSPTSDPNTNIPICNKCSKPCHGYTYHCLRCRIDFHFYCCLYLQYQHHQHPLCLFNLQGFNPDNHKCKICQFHVVGFTFACKSCEFYLHHECTLLPATVKDHHVHELTFNFRFPKESNQVYCDICEDRDGKELDRTASYYYCTKCDYIAHVHCVTYLQGKEISHFIHTEHPLTYSEKPPFRYRLRKCIVCDASITDINYHCNKCDWIVHEYCLKIPPSIRHPIHKLHDLTYRALGPDMPDKCSLCSEPVQGPYNRCSICKCSTDTWCARHIRHPSHDKHDLILEVESSYHVGDVNAMFRCNACGGLGAGFNMHCTIHGCNYDLHLECCLLPMIIHNRSHDHQLSLAFSMTSHRAQSLQGDCSVCGGEADQELWAYVCKECNYVAHLRCVADYLLSSIRCAYSVVPNLSHIHQCTSIVDTCKERLVAEDPEPRPLCSYSIGELKMLRTPLFGSPYDGCRQMGLSIKEINLEESSTVSINGSPGKFRFFKHDHDITILDEELSQIALCQVCNRPVFRPAYSCSACKFYLHKSCAELPHTCQGHLGHHIFKLVAAPLENGLSTCMFCYRPLKGYAYQCSTCDTVALDVRCAFMAPVMRHKFHEHLLVYDSDPKNMCSACGSVGYPTFLCPKTSCSFIVHTDCAMLPYTIKHGIHKHPLELACDLAALYDEYICDACEEDLNPKLWAYRCVDECKGRATSHVTCVISSYENRRFDYELECQGITRERGQKSRSNSLLHSISKNPTRWFH